MAGLCIHVRRGLACWLRTVLIDSSAVAVLTLILSAEMTDVGLSFFGCFFLPEFYPTAYSLPVNATAFEF